MPAIAPIEDLKAAQKEGLSIYAMLHVYPPKPLGAGGRYLSSVAEQIA